MVLSFLLGQLELILPVPDLIFFMKDHKVIHPEPAVEKTLTKSLEYYDLCSFFDVPLMMYRGADSRLKFKGQLSIQKEENNITATIY